MNRNLFKFAIVTFTILFSPLALADNVADAEAKFDAGFQKMKAGDFAGGCPDLAESDRLDPQPGVLLTLATCEFDWGRLATALSRYEEFLQRYPKAPPHLSGSDLQRHEARMKLATEQRDKLLREVPRLTVDLPPNTPTTVAVTCNGTTVDPAKLGIKTAVNPGSYVFTTQVPGGPLKEKRIDMRKGDTVILALEIELPPVPVSVIPEVKPLIIPETPPEISSHSGRKLATAGWLTFGTGGLLLAAGATAGIITMVNADEVATNCGSAAGFSAANKCNDIGKRAGETAQIASTLSTVGFIAGGIGIGTGLVLVLVAPKKETPKGAFMPNLKAGFSGGSAGATFQLRGTW